MVVNLVRKSSLAYDIEMTRKFGEMETIVGIKVTPDSEGGDRRVNRMDLAGWLYAI